MKKHEKKLQTSSPLSRMHALQVCRVVPCCLAVPTAQWRGAVVVVVHQAIQRLHALGRLVVAAHGVHEDHKGVLRGGA